MLCQLYFFKLDFYNLMEKHMPQTQYNATGITDSNKEAIQDAGMNLDGVSWVNVNPTNLVVTHNEGFDLSTFEAAITSVDSGVSLSLV